MFVLIGLLFPFLLQAQKTNRVEVVHANVFEFVKIGDRQIKKLKGNCVFRQDNVTLRCDSALLYDQTNSVDAFGKVHISQGDSLNLYGDVLKYDGNRKMARFNKNVKVIHNEMVLTTDVLDYDTKNRVATYPQGGKITEGENVLTSIYGYYYANTSDAFFRKNVVLTNPKYVLRSDTLQYNTETGLSTFFGPTEIISEKDSFYAERGTYNTRTDIAQFTKNSYYQSGSQSLSGDYLYYDRVKGIGKANRNIEFVDTAQNIVLRGHQAEYNNGKESILVTQQAYLVVLVDQDSLYLAADTLRSFMDDTMKYRTMLAYHDVRIYKSDLRARCDSLAYSYKDSVMHLYYAPTLWSQNAQMTSDYITLEMKNEQIHKMNLLNNAFLVMVDSLDSTKFDQIRGKNMFGYFIDNDLSSLTVEGNGQSVYYAKEEREDEVEYIGVNKADCSNMLLRFRDNKIQKVTFLTQPDAVFYPIDELAPKELELKGFTWREQLKPKSKEEVILRID